MNLILVGELLLLAFDLFRIIQLVILSHIIVEYWLLFHLSEIILRLILHDWVWLLVQFLLLIIYDSILDELAHLLILIWLLRVLLVVQRSLVVMVHHGAVELALTRLIQFSLNELFSVIDLVQVLLELSLVVRVIAKDGRALLVELVLTLINFIVKSLKMRHS